MRVQKNRNKTGQDENEEEQEENRRMILSDSNPGSGGREVCPIVTSAQRMMEKSRVGGGGVHIT